MLSLGPLAFASPWILTALLALPVIYWLLRVTPPAPRRVRFPAIQLLLGLSEKEQTPAHTPLWLLLFRLFLAALVILALARPVWNLAPAQGATGPLVVVVDNGWAAANRWPDRKAALDSLIAGAGRDGRAIVLAPTAISETPPAFSLMSEGEARRAADGLQPQPFGVDRASAAKALEALKLPLGTEIVWLADGLDDGSGAVTGERFAAIGTLTVWEDAEGAEPFGLAAPRIDGSGMTLRVLRADPGAPRDLSLRAFAADGRYLGETKARFAANQTAAVAPVELPVELRNDIARIVIDGQASAGAVTLLDESFRRRPVGLVAGGDRDVAQPLLSELHYVSRALEPFAELREGGIAELIQSRIAVLILADVGQIVGSDHDAVARFVEDGGVLVRFAGPRLAAQSDDLVPVKLRVGGRALDGALSWEKPQGLSAFPEGSPFAGLPVPADVTVARQVLAEPSLDLSEKTWARLTDGTPLVTAARRGKGTVVLVHVTANSNWSNLALSGLFVDMLRRLVALSHGIGAETPAGAPETLALAPLKTLDGFGRLSAPPPTVRPLSADALKHWTPSPAAPPGFYGPEGAAVALNLLPEDATLKPLPPLPPGASRATYGASAAFDLMDAGLALALALMVVDLVIGLLLRGFTPGRARAAPAAAALLLACLIVPLVATGSARAADEFAREAALQTRLAYIVTGDAEADAMSEAGLKGLTAILNERTAAEMAAPMGVNVETDELSFFPLLYWPMAGATHTLSPEALARIDAFMKNGGTILFDTRDGDAGAGEGNAQLRELLKGLDVPPLVPVPAGHVLTKAFYLLDDFPGRFTGTQVWVEAPSGGDGDPNAATATSSDGVSAIIIGSNDWAAAWARDNSGRPLAAVTPGGERQREMAMRFGVNLVMYALTGNYKSDQVHVPALLERLGQ